MWTEDNVPREGDLYKQLTVAGHCFELRYGYYEDSERQHCPPVVLYPDLSSAPYYSADGYPLVTQVQDICEYCCAEDDEAHWCSDCAYYSTEYQEIGICRCEHRRSKIQTGGP